RVAERIDGMSACFRRILLVVESAGDPAVERAVELAEEHGGHLTIAVVAPRPIPNLNSFGFCVAPPTAEQLRAEAAALARRLAGSVPAGVAVRTLVVQRAPAKAILKQVA